MYIGQKLRYAGGTTITAILQPYNLDGTMAESIVQLEQNGELWGYLTQTAVLNIEAAEQREDERATNDAELVDYLGSKGKK